MTCNCEFKIGDVVTFVDKPIRSELLGVKFYVINKHNNMVKVEDVHNNYQWVVSCGLKLYKEPVVEVRYAKATNKDRLATTLRGSNSVTFWSINKASDDNIKATFTDGELTQVEIV